MIAQLLLALVAGDAPNHFAQGVPLKTARADAALHELALPAVVYRTATATDAADLRVFNASGQAVPYAFRPVAATARSQAVPIPVPAFPIHGDPAAAESLKVRIRKGPEGATLEVQDAATPTTQRLVGYLLDAGEINTAISALVVDWTAPDSFNGEVRVDASDDLASWRTVAARAPLLRLSHADHKLLRDRIEFDSAKHKYWKITWPAAQPPLEDLSARAEPSPTDQAVPREHLDVKARAGAAEPRAFVFDLGGHYPFDRIQILPAQANTVARVTIATRDFDTDAWRTASTNLVYRLQDRGVEVSSPEIDIPGRGHRFVRLTTERPSELGAEPPSIRIGWIPHRLVFAARGPQPYQLAYGAAGVRSSAIEIDALIPGYGTPAAVATVPAEAGVAVELGGESRRVRPRNYRAPILWAVLAGAVGLLGWMALRLVRQTRPDAGRGGSAPE